MNNQTNRAADRLPEALRVGQSVLVVRGTELKLRELRPEGGRVEVLGSIDALGYETAPTGGLLRRFFG